MSLINEIEDIPEFLNKDKSFESENLDSGCLSDASDSSLDLPGKSMQRDGNGSDNEDKKLNTAISKLMTDSGFESHNGNEEKEVNDEKIAENEARTLINTDQPSVKEDSSKSSTNWTDWYQQDDDGDTFLHLACIMKDENLVKTILSKTPHSCLYDILNDDCQAPLHLAALTKRPNILRMLLLAGADPTVRDRRGNTALHLACRSGVVECVDSLIKPFYKDEIEEASHQYEHRNFSIPLSQDLDLRNYNGESCVHVAAKLGFIDILHRLVSHGADINAREKKCGRTPLHIAIERGNEILTEFLLNECNKKIDLEAITFGGLTAYQVAGKLEKLDLQNMLEKCGAEILQVPQSEQYNSDSESDSESDDTTDNASDPASGLPVFEDGHIKIADALIVGPL
ncbi:NF-kappa-B inhibitor cactus-like [Glossina fuscipes]|uniref:NF-kappa-B inhibitor cactus-like n=1 Tax=Glossina fuscipes TaxID=7396 RepID=A0A9C6DRU7_9MUSC|nr:NF-kappa-B inhibitor cactus-like [Glossina fuscipes]KAI9582331.1 hypothetical protein GQX74_015454 [Glossina fuscipes]